MEPAEIHDERVLAADHKRFATALLRAAGAAANEAEIVAEGLCWADLRGRHTNGLIRLTQMVDRLRHGMIRSPGPLAWTEVSAVAAKLDAGHALGHVAATAAIDRAVELARSRGVGLVTVRRSNHYGAAGYFAARAAERGCVSLNCTNAFPKVAPHGGRRPALGTNPIAFGCPALTGAPLLVDLSTSAVSGAEVRRLTAEGGQLPPGLAVDRAGRPTTDPSAVPSGCILPAAGPKGFGLALMVEVLAGLLGGGAVSDEVGSLFDRDRPLKTSHFFLAIDIERFVPADEFARRIGGLLEQVAATPLDATGRPIRYPGEIRARYAERYRRDGVPVSQPTLDVLARIAGELGVEPLALVCRGA